MTTCWRCQTETEMPLRASEGDTTVDALRRVHDGVAWPTISPCCRRPRPYQPLLDPEREFTRPRQSTMFDFLGGE